MHFMLAAGLSLDAWIVVLGAAGHFPFYESSPEGKVDIGRVCHARGLLHTHA